MPPDDADPVPRRIVAAAAVAKLALHLAVLAPYGYFRDELYYLACANHLALGYVDHPPFSIALLAAWRSIFGDSVEAIRLVPALAGSAVIVLTGRIVERLGGGRIAAFFACVALLLSPERLSTDHRYSMNSLDALLWALGAWLALRAAHRPERGSRWLLLGVVLGVGISNKWSVLWLGAGLSVGLLCMPTARRSLRTRWPWLGAGLACLIALPHFVWQEHNGWPTLEFMRNALGLKYVRPTAFAFLRDVVMSTNPIAALLWLPGIVMPFLSRHRREPLGAGRLLSAAFVTTLLIVGGSRGKSEYMVAATALVLAPGAVAMGSLLARWPTSRRRASVVVLTVMMLAFTGVVLPFALPILPVERFIGYQHALGVKPSSSEKKELGELPQTYADMHGWRELVSAAAEAYATLDQAEKPGAAIWAVTGGYGPAAAVDVLGARLGLPRAMSTHNAYWMWGPAPGEPRAVVLLGDHPRLGELFESLTLITRVPCRYCMPYERDKPIYVGRGMRRRFADFWSEAKHFE